VPTAVIDGLVTRYEVTGDGPPILMFSPGGFDSKLENWTEHGAYPKLQLLARLAERYTCITFDRRESGQAGGRIERLSWSNYVTQGCGLLDELGIERAFLMGACVGCSTAVAFAVRHPDRVRGLVLYSPAGGPRYRLSQHSRFSAHTAFVEQNGLQAVLELAHSHTLGFSEDPRVGPWVTVLRRDEGFAAEYVKQDQGRYLTTAASIPRMMFDRDTVSGAEPEDLLTMRIPALIVPGEDKSHAPSAARYLQECLDGAQYWDVPVLQRTADNAPARVIEFLDGAVNR
jgi:pimeloyl-ACP methyl ester carboxylesterase